MWLTCVRELYIELLTRTSGENLLREMAVALLVSLYITKRIKVYMYEYRWQLPPAFSFMSLEIRVYSQRCVCNREPVHWQLQFVRLVSPQLNHEHKRGFPKPARNIPITTLPGGKFGSSFDVVGRHRLSTKFAVIR